MIAPAQSLLGTARAGSWSIAGMIHTRPRGRGNCGAVLSHFLRSVTRPTAVPAKLLSWSLQWEIPDPAGNDQHIKSQVSLGGSRNEQQKRGFCSSFIKAPSRPHFLPLPANIRELLSFFSWLSPPKGTSDASGGSLESRMWGCEHAPGHKEAAGEEDPLALLCEAGHGNGQQGVC